MKDHTDITILLDRSGSMQSIKDDTIGGFNQFLTTQQEAGENASITLVQFDDQSIDDVCVGTAVRSAKKLTGEMFVPRGATPLLDALGRTIHRAGERLAAINEADRPDKIVFVNLTDGHENASHGDAPRAPLQPVMLQHIFNDMSHQPGAVITIFHLVSMKSCHKIVTVHRRPCDWVSEIPSEGLLNSGIAGAKD